MAKVKISQKQIAIDKNNANMFAAVAAAAFFAVFCLVSGKALISQQAYQAKVISKKKVALKQVNENKEQVERLKVSYQEFAGQTQNILEGNPAGTGNNDGENARIVLDALPSKYDFPALATSIQKILNDNGGFTLKSILGTDDEVAQAQAALSENSQPIEVPIIFSSETSVVGSQKILQTLERSIRPMQISKLNFTGTGTDRLILTVEMKSYYQPEKKFEIKTETVK